MKTIELLGAMKLREKHLIERCTIEAARAIAAYWDALRQIEEAHGVEFEGTLAALEIIATCGDLQNLSAWDCLDKLTIAEA